MTAFWVIFMAAFLGSFAGVMVGSFSIGWMEARKGKTIPFPVDDRAKSVQFLEQFERANPYPVDENGQIDPSAIERSMPPGLTD